MKIGTKLLAVVLASGLLVAVMATNLQHVYAQIDPGNFVLWKKTTHEFEKNVINAIGDPGISPGPRELLSAYVDDVNRIFLGGPDTLPRLVEQYQSAVLAVFVQPPEPDKQAQHEQIKEFRQLTKDFEGAVAAAIIAATQDNN